MGRKVFVTDIDETLIYNTTQATVHKPTGARYTAPEFARIPDRYERIQEWDFTKEWESEDLNVASILHDDGIHKNIELVKQMHEAGYVILYLTSRGGGNISIEKAISEALSTRLGFAIAGFALGDYGKYGKDKLPIKKRRVLEDLVNEYDEVIFMDDEDKNLEQARDVPGVRVLDAKANNELI